MKPSKKSKARLDRRQNDYKEFTKGGTGYGNGIYVSTGGGKPAMFHKPGSLKKSAPRGRGLK